MLKLAQRWIRRCFVPSHSAAVGMDPATAPHANVGGEATYCRAVVRSCPFPCPTGGGAESDCRPRETASRGGALSMGHGDTFAQIPGVVVQEAERVNIGVGVVRGPQEQHDFALAAALQQQEEYFAQQEFMAAESARQSREESEWDRSQDVAVMNQILHEHEKNENPGLWDPVWGQLTQAGEKPSYRQQMCFLWCPCVAIGCGGSGPSRTEVRRAWQRCLLSWSTLFGVVQVMMLVVAMAMAAQDSNLNVDTAMLSLPADVVDELGAKNAARILRLGEWWRLLTPIVLHVGWVHLLGNLMVQFRTSIMLEAVWGHSRWLLIYVWTGAYASLTSCVVAPDQLSVGSSGALCGLIGAWLSFIFITWNQTLPRDRKARNSETFAVVGSIAFIVALSGLPMIDFASHLGGLICGIFVAMLLFANRLQSKNLAIATFVGGLAGSLVLFGAMIFLFVYRTKPSEELLHVH